MKQSKAKRKRGERLTVKERIARLEKLIEALELELPDAPLRRAGIIERDLRLHRNSLRVERVHFDLEDQPDQALCRFG